MKKGQVQETIQELITGGAIPPYVYTYPTRSAYRELQPQWTVKKIWEADAVYPTSRDLNLYIHVPFCRYKCGFCNLYTVIATTEDIYDAYVDALCLHLEQTREIIESRRLKTIYIGGGTPSILSAEQLRRLFAKITEIYPGWRNSVDEVCIEATPDSIAA